MSETKQEAWIPLASSPNCFNNLATHLGANTNILSFVDISCLDIEYLHSLSPCHALLLTYTTISVCEGLLKQHDLISSTTTKMDDLCFFHQIIGGTCGTIAVIHALVNGVKKDNVLFKTFIPVDNNKSSLLRKLMMMATNNDDEEGEGTSKQSSSHQLIEMPELHEAHDRCAIATATKPGIRGQKQGRHFVCFIEHEGSLVMLDGRRQGPVQYGKIDPTVGFIGTAASFISNIICVAGDSMASSFSVIALSEQQS